MKLNKNYICSQIDGGTFIVPTSAADFQGVVRGNKTFDFIAECLQRETTEEEITEKLLARFAGDEEVIRADVAKAIRRLSEIGAIDGD